MSTLAPPPRLVTAWHSKVVTIAAMAKSADKPKREHAKRAGKEGASNLEMAGDRLKVYSLAEMVRHKQTRSKRPIMTLADVLVPWFEKTVEKPSAKLAGCAELWVEKVPKALAGATRLVGFSRGTLTVAVDNATIRAELDGALRRGLLGELQEASKGAIYRVKTCVLGSGIPEIS